MAGYTGTFKRKEVKYRLDAAQRCAVAAIAARRLAPDVFGSSRVNSLYYDTLRRDLIARSLEKPLYKEKLRARWYGREGEADAPDSVFVEMKKKFKGIVYKRRVALGRQAACAYLGGVPFEEARALYPHAAKEGQEERALAPVDSQIAREIDAMRTRYRDLRPSALITCRREAWARPEEGDALAGDGLRITIDDDLSYADLLALPSDDALQSALEGACDIHALIAPGEAIMEVKSAHPYPRWLIDALNEVGAYPVSFSKYGEMYKHEGVSHVR